MIVQCAACRARFKIADEKVTERGVKVRCTKCSTTFVVRKDGSPPPADTLPLGGRPPTGLAPQAPLPRQPSGLATGPAPRAPTPKGLARPDPFAPFKTSELKPISDPFAAAAPSPAAGAGPALNGSEPFSDLDFGGGPKTPAPAGLMEMEMQSPGLIGVGAPRPGPALPSDPFAGMQAAPAAAPAPKAASPFGQTGKPFGAPAPAIGDPFGAPPAAPKARSPFGQTGDPFAAPAPPKASSPFGQTGGAAIGSPFGDASSVASPFGPAPAARQPTPPKQRGVGDPFADQKLDLGASLGRVPAPAPAAPAAPAIPPLDLGARPAGNDPFASLGGGDPFSLGGPAPGAGSLAAPPAAAPPAPAPAPAPAKAAAKPSVPSFGGNELEFDTQEPSGLDLDLPSSPAPAPNADPFNKAAAAAELFGPRPSAPGPAAAAPRPKPAPEPEIELERTVVASRPVMSKLIEASSATTGVRPAPKWSRQRTTRKPAKKRSTAAALINALVFAVIGAALLGWAVAGQLNAASDPGGLIAAGAHPDLISESVSNQLYETAARRSVFLVHGKVRNIGDASLGPVEVAVELLSGSNVVRRAEAFVGPVPTPDDLYGLVDPAAVGTLLRRLAGSAAKVEPGQTGDFVAVFYEYPDDLPTLELRVLPQLVSSKEPAAPPSAPAAPGVAPATQPAAPAPAAPPAPEAAVPEAQAVGGARKQLGKRGAVKPGAVRQKATGTQVRFQPPGK